jgi:hypothetical protein
VQLPPDELVIVVDFDVVDIDRARAAEQKVEGDEIVWREAERMTSIDAWTRSRSWAMKSAS